MTLFQRFQNSVTTVDRQPGLAAGPDDLNLHGMLVIKLPIPNSARWSCDDGWPEPPVQLEFSITHSKCNLRSDRASTTLPASHDRSKQEAVAKTGIHCGCKRTPSAKPSLIRVKLSQVKSGERALWLRSDFICDPTSWFAAVPARSICG